MTSDTTHGEGAFALIAQLAAIGDLSEAAEAYRSSMRSAYWEDADIPTVTAMAYAGVAHLLAGAEAVGGDAADGARYAAKGLMYDLASFTWPGWDQPGVEIAPSDATGGLAAARMNLMMAITLERGDLAESRAQWMLGAHLLTGGDHDGASLAFTESMAAAERAGASAEEALARAFRALTELDAEPDDGEDALQAALADLARVADGKAFIDQVTTARRVLGR